MQPQTVMHLKAGSMRSIMMLCAASLCSVLLAMLGFVLAPAISHGEDHVEQTITYTVQQGDTLWQYAQQTSQSISVERQIERIRRMNDLHTYDLQVGQTIVVPVDAA